MPVPAKWGSCSTFFKSVPVKIPAKPRVMAENAPDVTVAASECTIAAILSPILSCSSSIIQK